MGDSRNVVPRDELLHQMSTVGIHRGRLRRQDNVSGSSVDGLWDEEEDRNEGEEEQEEEEEEDEEEEEEEQQNKDKICHRCNSRVLLDEDVENDLEQQIAQYQQQDDELDGSTPRAQYVERVCHCGLEESIKQKIDSELLLRSDVVREYHEKVTMVTKPRPMVSKIPQDSSFSKRIKAWLGKCLARQSSFEDFHDISEKCIKVQQIYITNPDVATGSKKEDVPLGFAMVSLKDGHGHVRHFVDDVIRGTPADYIKLKYEDELLMLNDRLLIDEDPDEVRQFFLDVHCGSDQEFVLLTRRVTEHQTEDKPYDYWQITAAVTVDITDDVAKAENVRVTQAIYNENDLVVFHDADPKSVYIETSDGYLRNVKGKLKVGGKSVVAHDPRYTFERLDYRGYVMKSNKMVQKNVRILRHSQGGSTSRDGPPLFVYAFKHRITLKQSPETISNPPRKEEIENKCNRDGFAVSNTVFFGQSLNSHEPFQQGYFLKMFTKTKRLALEFIKTADALRFRDDIIVTFHVQRPDGQMARELERLQLYSPNHPAGGANSLV